MTQVTAISVQSVLVGAEVGGCAFVCGSLSFLDKMSCGIALYVLQSHQSKFLFSNRTILVLAVLAEDVMG